MPAVGKLVWDLVSVRVIAWVAQSAAARAATRVVAGATTRVTAATTMAIKRVAARTKTFFNNVKTKSDQIEFSVESTTRFNSFIGGLVNGVTISATIEDVGSVKLTGLGGESLDRNKSVTIGEVTINGVATAEFQQKTNAGDASHTFALKTGNTELYRWEPENPGSEYETSSSGNDVTTTITYDSPDGNSESFSVRRDTTNNKVKSIESVADKGTSTRTDKLTLDGNQKPKQQETEITTDNSNTTIVQKTYNADGTLATTTQKAELDKKTLLELGMTNTEIAAMPSITKNGATKYVLSRDLGSNLGSSIGRMMGGSNQFRQIAGDTIVGTIGLNLGRNLGVKLTQDGTKIDKSKLSEGLGADLKAKFQSASLGATISFLTAELGKKLGLRGFGAGLFNAALNPVMNNFLYKAQWLREFFDIKKITELGKGIGGGIASFIGTYIGGKIVQARTKIGATIQNLASMAGAIWAASSEAMAAAFNFVAPGVGALIGAVVGGLVARILGRNWSRPSGKHHVGFRNGADTYGRLDGWNKNNAAMSFIDGLGREIAEMLNGVIKLVGANDVSVSTAGTRYSSVNAEAKASISKAGIDVRQRSSRFWLGYNGREHNFSAQSTTSTSNAINAALKWSVYRLNFKGGNILNRRAVRYAKANNKSFKDLIGVLNVASDYDNYLKNKELINATMAVNPDSVFAAGWALTFMEVNNLGLKNLHADDLNERFGWSNLLQDHNMNIVRYKLVAENNTIMIQHKITGAKIDLETILPGAGEVFYKLNKGQTVSPAPPYKALIGTSGANTLEGSANADWLQGGGGNDILRSNGGADWLFGDAGNDTLYGHDGPERDALFGGTGNDKLNGGTGRDTYEMEDGDGKDVITDAYSTTKTTTTYGKWGSTSTKTTTVHAKNFFRLNHASNKHVYVELIGKDLWIGVSTRKPSSATALKNLSQTIQIKDWKGQFDFFGVNKGNYSASDLISYYSRNALRGTSGANTLTGTSGNDVLWGFGGNDRLNGGTGRDTYIIENNNGQDIITDAYSKTTTTTRTTYTTTYGKWGGVTRTPTTTTTTTTTVHAKNVLEFKGIEANRIHLDLVGKDLVIGIVNSGSAAQGVLPTANRVTIKDWKGQFDKFKVGGYTYTAATFTSIYDKDYVVYPDDWTWSGNFNPVTLDLDADGLSFIDTKAVYYDIDGDNIRDLTAWVGASDGLLAYDKDGDDDITDRDEISFVSYLEGAMTDLQGLAAFDTDGDGWLDSGDAEFSKFRVWRDANSNGEVNAGELNTLAVHGIARVRLAPDPYSDFKMEHVDIHATGVFETVDGETRMLGDVGFAYDASRFDVYLSDKGVRVDLANPGKNTGLAAGQGRTHHVNILGSGYDDDLRGDTKANTIKGARGNDELRGRGGDDHLLGGRGADLLKGGRGDDRLSGGQGIDTVLYTGAAGHYRLSRNADGLLVIEDKQANRDGTDTLKGIERVQFADALYEVDSKKQVLRMIEAMAALPGEQTAGGVGSTLQPPAATLPISTIAAA